jgi:hypothetical protein
MDPKELEALEKKMRIEVMKDENLNMEKVINNLKIPKNYDQIKHV